MLPKISRNRFLMSWLLGRLGASRSMPTGHPPHVVFVCYGNIMRSALAELVARRAAIDAGVGLRITSAGVQAIEGRAADPRAMTVAREMGLSLAAHRARRLTRALVDDADFIVAMDHANEACIVSAFPAAARRVHLLLGPGREVADPCTGTVDDVRRSAMVIDHAVRQLVGCVAARRSVTGESVTLRWRRLRLWSAAR